VENPLTNQESEDEEGGTMSCEDAEMLPPNPAEGGGADKVWVPSEDFRRCPLPAHASCSQEGPDPKKPRESNKKLHVKGLKNFLKCASG
jgi:hypothetical protein